MPKDFQLHLQVSHGQLRLLPAGWLNPAEVHVILGAARSGLTLFPVIIIDLQQIHKANQESLKLLEEGLEQIIAEKKLALCRECPRLGWHQGGEGWKILTIHDKSATGG
ncbi:MAG: hypothetical protein JRI57_06280 [Deltaproteobacteria bacterium]|nr:hypothetical protein [Deltaproteobacteria bacterium]MBW1952433.1 hypothetical protein [Deltaproteobacteria bacterium]MBW1986677.1 hypothetical protein [Deltaproteobacteria bacterium]MBW2134885.1 hypothetical protein [Deltaproteobacteria bacterium]